LINGRNLVGISGDNVSVSTTGICVILMWQTKQFWLEVSLDCLLLCGTQHPWQISSQGWLTDIVASAFFAIVEFMDAEDMLHIGIITDANPSNGMLVVRTTVSKILIQRVMVYQ